LRQKWSRGQVEARLANMPPCLIGMEEAYIGAHHLNRKLKALGHVPAKYVRPYSKGQKNDFRDVKSLLSTKSPSHFGEAFQAVSQ
jgi:transposase